jgi:hypothetical protein
MNPILGFFTRWQRVFPQNTRWRRVYLEMLIPANTITACFLLGALKLHVDRGLFLILTSQAGFSANSPV